MTTAILVGGVMAVTLASVVAFSPGALQHLALIFLARAKAVLVARTEFNRVMKAGIEER